MSGKPRYAVGDILLWGFHPALRVKVLSVTVKPFLGDDKISYFVRMEDGGDKITWENSMTANERELRPLDGRALAGLLSKG